MTIHCLGVVLHHCPSLHQSVFPHSPPTTLTVQSLRPSQLLPSPFQIFPLFLACPAWRLVTFLSALSVPWSSSSPSAPASPWLPSFYFPLPAPSPSGHSASPPLQSFLPLFALILSSHLASPLRPVASLLRHLGLKVLVCSIMLNGHRS